MIQSLNSQQDFAPHQENTASSNYPYYIDLPKAYDSGFTDYRSSKDGGRKEHQPRGATTLTPQSRAEASSEATFPDLHRLLIHCASVISGAQRRSYSIDTRKHKRTRANIQKPNRTLWPLTFRGLTWAG